MRKRITTTVINGKRVESLTKNFSIWKNNNKTYAKVAWESPDHAHSSVRKVSAHKRRKHTEEEAKRERHYMFQHMTPIEYRVAIGLF